MSWGRTLELSTLASPDACDWLEATTSARTTSAGASGSRKYNLLLTRSSEERGQRRGDGPSATMVGASSRYAVSVPGAFPPSASAAQQMFGLIPRRRRGSAARGSSPLFWPRRRKICAPALGGRDGGIGGTSELPLQTDRATLTRRARLKTTNRRSAFPH